MCDKVCYHDQLTAINSIRGIRKDKRPSRSKKKPVQAYYCSTCHAWHLSSRVKHRMGVVIKNTIKDLSASKRIGKAWLQIRDFTGNFFQNNDNMARFVCLLSTVAICFTVSAFGYDSEVDKDYSVSGVELVSVDYGYPYGDIATLDVEMPAEFVISAPALGHASTIEDLIEVKASEGFLCDVRGPPDSCSQKS